MRYLFVLTVLLVFLFIDTSGQRTRKAYQLYEDAESAHINGLLEQATLLVNECIKHYPDYYEAYTLRGAIREELKDTEGALTDYSIFLDWFPTHPEALMSRGVLHYKLRHFDLARTDFELILRIGSTVTNAIFFRQNMSVNDGNPILTTSHNTHHPYVYQYLGLVAYNLKHFEKAVQYYDSAIQLNKREADFFFNRGNARMALNDSSAKHDFEMALFLNPEHGMAKHAISNSSGAASVSRENFLTETIQMDSTLLFPYLERGKERYASGDYAGAVMDYDLALKRNDKDPEIWLARGLAREHLDDFTGAFSDYTRAIDLNESFAKAWVNRGNVLLKQKRFNDAIEDYEVSLLYWPDNGAAYYNRGVARISVNQKTQGCADLKMAETLGIKGDEKLKVKICGN